MEHKKKAYSCKIFTVWEEEVQFASGAKAKQSWIEHKPTVAIVAVNENKELLMIRQFRLPTGGDFLEIPAGSFDDDGESPVDCAQRELAEETGFRAGRLTELFAGYLLPGYCNEYMYFFLAEDLVYDPLIPDEDEFIDVIPLTFDRVFEMVRAGDIPDAKTALGLLLAERYLNNKTNFSKTSL
ncbi:MAG TPA: NUDIX hydrolase [Smithellaceae bacterium]|nr:NUDIX hydrolase [Smithellaceae bacterium]